MTEAVALLDVTTTRHVEAIFVENAWMFSAMKSQGNCPRVIFAPPGIDTDFFCPSGGRGDDFILAVARFGDPRKNVRLLFDAYRLLVARDPATPRLVLAGKTGPNAGDWAYAASLGVAGRVEILEDVTDADLAALYRNAAVFVLSSDEEGLGLVLLEAMASGTPVVSTRCGGPDVIITDGQDGFLTPVGEAGALASRVGELLASSKLRRTMGLAGRQTVVERFSITAAGRTFLETYDELLSCGSRNSPRPAVQI